MNLARNAFLAMGLAFCTISAAADFDGSTPLTCLATAGHDCSPGHAQCAQLKSKSKGPPEIGIDFANKTVRSPYRTALLPILTTLSNDEQLIMQGSQEKFAWSAIVNRKTGALTISIADRVGSYIVFGQCKAASAAATSGK
jgi:hypothetical protein